jgi:diguanylate cyclase (GGDEF)-like protein/PAS domain S-box-containing protein
MLTIASDVTAHLRAVSRWLAMAVVLVSTLGLVGRLTQTVLPPLMQPIAVTTGSAWALLLAGISLWLRQLGNERHWRRASLAAAAVLLAFVFAVTGADTQAARAGVSSDVASLPIQSAVALALLGSSLLTIDWEFAGALPSQFFASGAVLIALVVASGYLYDVPQIYATDPMRPVPIQESIMLFLAGTAVLFERPDRGLLQVATSDTTGGMLARSMPAAVLIAPALLGWLAHRGERLGWYDPSAAMAMLVIEFTVFFSLVIFRVARSLDRTDCDRRKAEWQLRQRSLQRANIADLGQRALAAGNDPQSVRQEAVALIMNSLSADWGEFVEAQDDGGTFAPTTGPDRDRLLPSAGTLVTRALAADHPLLVEDLAGEHVQDRRLADHGVNSAALVAVRGSGRAHGVICIYSDRRAAFTEGDGHLLQTVASMLAAVEDRQRSETALRASEAKFSGLFRSIPDAIAIVRRTDRRVIEVNDAFLQMTELALDDIVHQPIDRPGLWVGASSDPVPDLVGDVPLRNVEFRFRTKSGGERVALCSTEFVTLEEGPAVLAVMRDISARRAEQDAIERANASLGNWVDELEGRSREISLLNELSELLHACVAMQEAYAVTTRFAERLLPGTSGALCLFAGTAGLLETVGVWGEDVSRDASFAPEDCWALRRGRPHAVAPDGGLLCAHAREDSRPPCLCVPMVAQGEPLGVLHVSGTLNPASADARRLVEAIAEASALALANLRLRDRLRRQSIRDQLTGLFNRWYLEESLERELVRSRRARRSLGLILMDFDDFKAVNDTFGHHAGDELLRSVGALFRTKLRSSDFACRWGGDEFLLILPETTLEDAMTRADEIRVAITGAGIHHRGNAIGSTVSAGIAAFPDHGAVAVDLLKAADAALYLAKARGGNRAEVTIPQTSHGGR